MKSNQSDVPKNGQQDVDQEIGTTTTLEEDTHWWEDDGKNDLADIAEDLLAKKLDHKPTMTSSEQSLLATSSNKLVRTTYEAVKGMVMEIDYS